MKKTRLVYCLGLLALVPLWLLQKERNPLMDASPGVKEAAGQAGVQQIITLAEAFKSKLDTKQLAQVQLAYSKQNAVRWSNFPQEFAHPNRVGISLGSLNPDQLAAAKALMAAALSQDSLNEGYGEMEGILTADDYLGKATGKSSTFGSGNYYIAFLGKPSTTDLWELQFGGHHFAFSNTYKMGAVAGATPSFRGVEPMKPLTADNKTYQPMEQEKEAFSALIGGLSAEEKKAAKLSSSFDDVLLGPGEDGNFPATKAGVKAGSLNPAQQALVIKCIQLYVNDLDAETARGIMKQYLSELPDTYFSYSGTGTMEQTADYVRIDGPGVWIEYAVQPSRDFPNTTHPHSIWRDHIRDYGGN